MKRRISILLIVSLILTQLMPCFPSITVNAADGDRIDLYKGEEVQIYSEKNPLVAMDETADLSLGTYLKVLVSLDGVEKGKQVFQYDQNPGKLLLAQNELYGISEIKLDGNMFDPNTEITFLQENQLCTLEVALYTKAKLTVHYQDVNGASISDDTLVEGKLNETVAVEVKSIEDYDPLQTDRQVTLDSVTKETVIQYQKKPVATEEGESAPDVKNPIVEENDPNTDAKDPAIEEKDPTTNEKDPTADEKDPNGKEDVEEKSEDPAAGEEQVVPEGNLGSGESGTTVQTNYNVRAKYYDPSHDMNIVGNDVYFKVESSPIKNGKLIIKLPAFFKLTKIPPKDETGECSVEVSEEIIDKTDEKLGKLLAGVKRQVVTLKYNNPTSTVSMSFIMNLMDKKGLTEAMILAGKDPDKVPLNLNLYLQDEKGVVLTENNIDHTSTLPSDQDHQLEFTRLPGTGPVELKNVNCWGEDKERPRKGATLDLRSTDTSGGISSVSLKKFHYPYTNVELWMPRDRNRKVETFNNQLMYSYNDFRTIEEKTYNGTDYFVGRLDVKDQLGQSETVGDSFKEYWDGDSFSPSSLRLYFSKTIQDQDYIVFDKPVFLKYTYKGEEHIQELYTLGDYTFSGYVPPKLFWWYNGGIQDSMSRDVKCGSPIYTYFKGWNCQEKQLPLDREDVTVRFEYPYEVQPTEIYTLKDKEGNEFKADISYHVENPEDPTKEREVTSQEKIGKGYKFDIGATEYVSSITINLQKFEAYDTFDFATRNITTTEDIDGNAITGAKWVEIKGTMKDDNLVTSTVTHSVGLMPLTDDLYTNMDSNQEVVLEDRSDVVYKSPYLKIRKYKGYTKDYENATFTLDAPWEVMSKISGFFMQVSEGRSYAIEGGVTIQYDTNKKRGNIKRIEANKIGETTEVKFALDSNEYVTGFSVKFDKLKGSYIIASPKDYLFTIGLGFLLDTKRTYYTEDGEEHPIPLEDNHLSPQYEFSYNFSTTSPPANYMTKDKMKSSIQYLGHETFSINRGYSSYKMSDTKAYRGEKVSATFSFAFFQNIWKYYRNPEQYSNLDPRYHVKNERVYFEVRPEFEITGLSTPEDLGNGVREENLSVVLEKKETLTNGNVLYIFRIPKRKFGRHSGSEWYCPEIRAKLYIRPDAKTDDKYNPIVGAGFSYADYFKEVFPDVYERSDYSISKTTYPHQIVEVKDASKDKFPEIWGLDPKEKQFGYYYDYSQKEKFFDVMYKNTSTTQMMGSYKGMLQDDGVNFKEVDREKLGFSAFISATGDDTVSDYTATFEIPKKDQSVANGKFNARYTLYANGPLKAYLNGKEMNVADQIRYYNENDVEIYPKIRKDFDGVRKVTIHFEQLSSHNVYEVKMPLYADIKDRSELNDLLSYIGTNNKTGDNPIVHGEPISFVYESYELHSDFGLDYREDGYDYYSDSLNVNREIQLYDRDWNLILKKGPSSSGFTFHSMKFNADINSVKYVGFSLDPQEADNYFATRMRQYSDISDQYIHEFADGKKVWYLPAKADDFITDSTRDKYDALFIRKPDIVADALTCGMGEEKELPYSYNQPVNPGLNKKYQVEVALVEPNQNIVELIQDGKTYKVKGLKEGTVEYEVTVTNTQGMKFTARNTITVGIRQINVTVPLYVCMYAYGGDGKVVAPEDGSYAITNHSDCAVQVSSIQATESTWKLKDAQNGLQAGEIHMKIADRTVRTTLTDLSSDSRWLIEKPQDKDVGAKLKLPIHGIIAGGSVNEDGESAVCNVQYTVKPAN